ncbi:LOW QUALITY PROTEIN: uncharacterized protein [Procambarus clarkii]|uniref:LOW QUALITY PROTEIN: uncharacterized protein n=1 Tax=Procambarus clarkii TaxID=6728 RepID=UPI001E676C77|nr:endoglucanase E-4-like [Procambarus clarkii]WGC43864.1 GH9-6 [Procambarus clarkii]
MTGALTRTFLLGVAALLHTGVVGQASEMCPCFSIRSEWDGNYDADFSVKATTRFTGLIVHLTFDNPVDSLNYWQGTVEKVDSTHFTLTNQIFSAVPNDDVTFGIEVHFTGTKPIITGVIMNGDDVCDGVGDWTTPHALDNPCDATGMTPYDYSQVLCMSYVFYEAQRSGKLPADQRVTWRGDSALDDGSDVGHDLSGGYYDAGDHVKFGFPMAYTATVLAWGLLDFEKGHELADQVEYGRAAVKWAADYFIKAHTAHYEFYGQVGEGNLDHGYWGRPEEMTMDRPSYKIDSGAPGSDLAAETAAALAAASIIFKDVDSAYASKVLSVAEELYAFADEDREVYSNSITDAAAFYRSWSGYGDELCWGALWLYRATGDDTYLTKARAAWEEFDLGTDAVQFSWDDKKAGVYALYSQIDPATAEYKTALETFLSYVMNDAPTTPQGMVFLDTWGANRHAANVAFIALYAAQYVDQANSAQYRQFAQKQIDLLLGDAGHSFVVGYGVDSPQRPHHRSSSCPWPPASCTDGWAQQQPGPNPHVLYGALVGGPAEDGTYSDDRNDYVHNEVACDYNAAFTGALAALVELS